MTWDECEKHNLKYYKEVFIVPKFDPQNFGEWHQLIQKMDPNLFISAYHLKKSDEQWHDNNTSSWENLVAYANRHEHEWGQIKVGCWEGFETVNGLSEGGMQISEHRLSKA